jgi:hypothetical protein
MVYSNKLDFILDAEVMLGIIVSGHVYSHVRPNGTVKYTPAKMAARCVGIKSTCANQISIWVDL